jgi:penicillin-binding protein 1C
MQLHHRCSRLCKTVSSHFQPWVSKFSLHIVRIGKSKFFQKSLSTYHKLPAWTQGVLIALLINLSAFFILDLAFPLDIKEDYSKMVYSSENKLLFATLNSNDKWRMKSNLEEITPLLQKTIVEKEDRYFWVHPGINPVSILRAAFNNVIQGRRTSGASTITMQVARLLEPKERTYIGKIMEVFRALQLEWHFSKKEILQMYLNRAPYGGNIEGLKSAAWFYLDQKPQTLSLAQIVTLSIIPNNPNLIKPGADLNILLKERNRWLDYFRKEHVFEPSLIDDAKMEPLNFSRQQRPMMAPHLSWRLIQKYPDSLEIHSAIKIEIQRKAEEIVRNYSASLQFMNITNAAVIIADNSKREIVGYIGSADFQNSRCSGQVDGVQAIRSPGSTLKPYLYALAIDKGLITPKMMIADVPINFDGYAPQNYDQKYRGMVSVENALAQSLNIPAVKILNEYGVNPYINMLIRSGFKRIRTDHKKLGLSLILGGCGVKLEELCNLFSVFAHNGIYYPNKLIKGQKVGNPDRLISEAASFLITENLTRLERPDLPVMWGNSTNLPQIAWKTGTSYGRRDAWSVGYNKDFTIAVWLGNFDGTGTPELTGAQIATPLLFQLFNAIDVSQERKWFAPPKTLDFRIVCSESGLPPSEFCTNTTIDYFIPGVSPYQKCEHLKEVYVNAKETMSYCRSCLPAKGYKTKLYPNYPPELIAFFEEEHRPYEKIPPHNPACKRIFNTLAPTITSLGNGMEYILISGEKQQLMLKCNADNTVKKVWWYLDNKLVKQASVNEKVFFTPTAGNHKVSCTDDNGRNTDIWITVKII